MKVLDDEKIWCVWQCASCGEKSYVKPWDCQDIGTPYCAECDEQMEYIRTEIAEGGDELLAALKELVAYDDGSNEPEDYGYELLQRCKAAIAKAEGRGE